jgi:Domain of unknown function (DUF397)
MALERDLAAIVVQCERLIRTHEYDPVADACARCGQSWACYARLSAEDLLEGLRQLPDLDPSLTGGSPSEGVHMQAGEQGWRTSTFSGESGNCVEVKPIGGAFAVRDSKTQDSPILVFSAAEWSAFTQGVRAGEFDN